MDISFGREICADLGAAESREWLVTNGIGGFACGTVAGILTRHYHGLLVAALNPPTHHTLLATKLDETVRLRDRVYPLYTNRWANGTVNPRGYYHLQQFRLEGTIPTWTFACQEALLEKQVWMEQGQNTTYIRYTYTRGEEALKLSLEALVNYRDRHGGTTKGHWQVKAVDRGISIEAFERAVPFYLFLDRLDATFSIAPIWHEDFDLAVERYRGTGDRENHLHAATFEIALEPGESVTVVASTEIQANLEGSRALEARRAYDRELLDLRDRAAYLHTRQEPDWIDRLVLAADRFIVNRPLPDRPDGKTIIAGYPWFADWGRDTMISLPGLTVFTGRPEIARTILGTYARYLDRGMLPNVFPDRGDRPAYNTADASLWFAEAVRSYYAATGDRDFLEAIFPAIEEIVRWYRQGTRYNIHWDRKDGLIYAGEPGVQVTWMDAKVDRWVVTPRQGKPIEINALWYNLLRIAEAIAKILQRPDREYQDLAKRAAAGFDRFWNPTGGYCYDVLDTPTGNDPALRPNQLLAVSLSGTCGKHTKPLLAPERQKAIVDTCARELLTSYGLRSLAPSDPHYQGHYGGDRYQRDGAYHQGTAWGWLLGPFVEAHFRVYQDTHQALEFLKPISQHLQGAGLGSISEIFDGDPPITPRGCFAQAWSVAEVLRVHSLVSSSSEERSR
ncbi:MAG: amylo-alpha-1,6-glucosidase [Cyanobacteriota bacterium]|nr:amylo-alpha-1,6-glucosidase [Cyanobacteriota bacterium]